MNAEYRIQKIQMTPSQRTKKPLKTRPTCDKGVVSRPTITVNKRAGNYPCGWLLQTVCKHILLCIMLQTFSSLHFKSMCNYLSAINCRSVEAEFGQCLNQHTGNILKPKQMWRYHTNMTSRVTTMNMYHNNMTVCWKSYSAGIRASWRRGWIDLHFLKHWVKPLESHYPNSDTCGGLNLLGWCNMLHYWGHKSLFLSQNWNTT